MAQTQVLTQSLCSIVRFKKTVFTAKFVWVSSIRYHKKVVISLYNVCDSGSDYAVQ